MKTRYFTVHSQKIDAALAGLRVAHISDLHNHDFKGKLLERLGRERPDVIVITGDMIDREKKSAAALRLACGAVKLAPTYYVSGNHESVLDAYPRFTAALTDAGVHVLENETAVYEREGARIVVLGMNDPRFFAGGKRAFAAELQRQTAAIDKEDFVLLLSHRPELFETYAAAGVDLALAGHAHGGQVRLPFIGALYAPGQGLLPKLTEGKHEKDGCTLIISRGMGRCHFVPRIFNAPELLIVTLCRGNDCGGAPACKPPCVGEGSRADAP